MFIYIKKFFYQQYCYGCGRPDALICRNCIFEKTEINLLQICHVCDKEVRVGMVHKECVQSSYLDGHIYLFRYESLIKKLISESKYNGYYANFSELGSMLSNYLFNTKLMDGALVTHVPMHPFKKFLRGFNQAEILANSFAKRRKLDHINIFQRSKFTKAQMELDRELRKLNLKNVITLKVNLELCNISKIVIVDDVYTTGSTLNECTKVLKEKYPNIQVIGLTIAKV